MRWRGRGRRSRGICWQLLLQNVKDIEIDENLLAYRGRGLCRMLLWKLLSRRENEKNKGSEQ